MAKYYLFAVRAAGLEDARGVVESVLGIGLDAREGLYMGGNYYSAGFPNTYLRLRENIDLDDDQGEFHGLSEVEFPNHKWLLYIDDAEVRHDIVARIEADATHFVRLRVS